MHPGRTPASPILVLQCMDWAAQPMSYKVSLQPGQAWASDQCMHACTLGGVHMSSVPDCILMLACAMIYHPMACVRVWQAGGHDKHDYIMYVSPAGGCCDCGDPTAWAEDGCCPAHRPLNTALLAQALQEEDRLALNAVLDGAFVRLAKELSSPSGGSMRGDCSPDACSKLKSTGSSCCTHIVRSVVRDSELQLTMCRLQLFALPSCLW